RSIQQPVVYWQEKANAMHWFEKPREVLSRDENGIARWFKGGKTNASFNCLDVHVNSGRGHQSALIWDSPVTSSKAVYTYTQMRDEVSRVAGVLRHTFGITKGDRVVIYMPAIPQGVRADGALLLTACDSRVCHARMRASGRSALCRVWR